MLKSILTFLILLPIIANAQVHLSGKITDDKNEPIVGANVFIENTYDGTSTGINGEFTFSTTEQGRQILVVSFIGYETVNQEIDLQNKALAINITLEESINRLDAVVITAGSFAASEESNREVLKPIDIATTAGATADIAGALNTLPGTQQVGETGRLFVRGGQGYETKTFIDGIGVLKSYSPSAPNTPGRTRFSPFMFSGTSFSTGGYSAEYGQALSSALILNSRDSYPADRTDISLMTVGGDVSHTRAFEKSSVAAKIQYTNLEPYFQLVSQKLEWDKAPQSIDGNLLYRYKTGEAGTLKFYSNFNHSDFVIYQSDILNPELKNRISQNNNYYYANASYKEILDDKWSLKSGVSYTSNVDKIDFDGQQVDERDNGIHGKVVMSYDPQEKLAIIFGVENFYNQHDFEFFNSSDDNVTLDYGQNITAAFAEADFYLSNRLVLRGGLRTEYNSLQNRFYASPRLSLARQLGENDQVSLAYGTFNQSGPEEFIRIKNDLRDEKAEHLILNYQWNKSGRTFRVEGYHKKYNDLIKYNDPIEATTFTNGGDGYANGVDFFWRDNKTLKGVDYWVSYSYLDTERDYRNYPGTATPTFASNHNLSVVFKGFINPIKTQVGATYSFASPRKYNDPNASEFNAGQTPTYHDLSMNFSHLYRSNVIIHLSVTNVLGTNNIFGYEYSDTPNDEGVLVSRAIKPAAPRFVFLGIFITLSKDKNINQLPAL